jgi:starch phosphorylase
VHFGNVDVETQDSQYSFRVQVFSGGFSSEELGVEIYADQIAGGVPIIQAMTASGTSAESGLLIFTAQVPANRPLNEYTARIIPHHANASVPLEAGQIIWQH